MARYSAEQHKAYAAAFERDGMVVLPGHFEPETLMRWREAFEPLFQQKLAEAAGPGNRGEARHYVTLPFSGVFADPSVVADEDVLAIVELVAGADPVMCQLATDTPVLGSTYQDVHRDTPELFPGEAETPSFQLAVNFPLCDVTPENGAFETTRGTHRMSRQEGMAAMERGDAPMETIPMKLGDVMIRDVRVLHRGTPNTTASPRPMVVIGYSRRWYFRPEVRIDVPRETLEQLPTRTRRLLRFNPVVERGQAAATESYTQFAY